MPRTKLERKVKETHDWIGYHIVLALLLILLAVDARTDGTQWTNLAYTAVLLISIWGLIERRWVAVVGTLLAILSLLFMWHESFWVPGEGHQLQRLIPIVFFLLVIVAYAKSLFQHSEVTPATVSGALCIYMFLGHIFALVYAYVQNTCPEEMGPAFKGIPDSLDHRTTAFFYFSFVTMTTLGYGDIVPLSDTARAVTVTQAIVGQLYLVVVVARLVGMAGSPRRRKHAD